MGLRSELKAILTAQLDPQKLGLAEYWMEELVFRALEGRSYSWDADSITAKFAMAHGLLIEISGDESEGKIFLNAHLQDNGQGERRAIDKYFMTAKEKCEAALRKANWRISESRAAGARQIKIAANIDLDMVKGNFGPVVESVKAVVWDLRFD
jgi:hypothetical protein